MADRLFISVRTAEMHRANITRKLGVRTRAELVVYARSEPVLREDVNGRPA